MPPQDNSPIPSINFNMPEPMTPAESLWRQAHPPQTGWDRANAPLITSMSKLRQASLDRAQQEQYQAVGPESQGKSFLPRLGHEMASFAYEANAGAAGLLGGLSPVDLGVMGGSAALGQPELAGAYYATKGADSALGVTKPSSIKAAYKNPTPENVQGALFDTSMMAGPLAGLAEKGPEIKRLAPEATPEAAAPSQTPISQGPRKTPPAYDPKEFQSQVGINRFLEEVRKPENQPDFSKWTQDEIEEFRRRTPQVGEPVAETTKAGAQESAAASNAAKGSGRPVQASEGPSLANLWDDKQIKTIAGRFSSLDDKTIQEANGLSGEEANKRYTQAMSDQDTALKNGSSISDPDYISANERASLYKHVEAARADEKSPLGEKGVRSPGADDPERGSLSLRPLKKPDPAVARAAEANRDGLSGVLDKIFDAITPSPERQTTKNIIREVEGVRSRWMDQRHEEFEKLATEHDNDTVADLIAFNNAGEGKPGAVFMNPRDQAAAARFHDIYQNVLRPELQKINPDKFQGAGIENYLGRLFKKGDSQATAESMVLQKGPFEGSKAFTKHRAYDWIDESIAAGAKPITNNPIRMQTLVTNQIMKYITAHKAFDYLKEEGLTKFFRVGGNKVAESASPDLRTEHPPAGWQRIDDSIFKPRYKAEGVAGLVEPGNYYMHPDAAKVFNNWLKPGLRGNPLYDTARTIGDTMNMAQLGFSAFHLTTTSVAGAATSDVALGLQQMFRYGKPIKGAISIAKGTTIFPSMLDTFSIGHAVEQEYLRPGTHPWAAKYAADLERVNGGIGQGLVFDKQRMLDLKKLWGEDGALGKLTLNEKGQGIGTDLGGRYNRPSDLKIIAKAIPAAAEWSSRWLMRYYVPRIKLGMFAKMAYEIHGEMLEKGASPGEISTELGKAWDSVDNRAGQMRYKNRFWNPVVKDLAGVAVRSVGWSGGTLDELGGGVTDAAKTLTGRAPLSARTAYTIAAITTTAALGGTMHYLMTGQIPRKTENYFFPGPEGHQLMMPTYISRDAAAYTHDPVNTVLNKLGPLPQEIGQMLKNSDFYNTEIRHPGDNAAQQAVSIAKYLAKTNLPISYQSGQQARERGDAGWKSYTRSQLGFTPAPAWVGKTKFENNVYDLSKRNWKVGPRTTDEFERSQALSQFKRQQASGTLNPKELQKAVIEHKLRASDIDSIAETEPGTTGTEAQFRGLSIQQQIGTLKDADANERAHYKGLLHFDQLEDLPQDERDMLIQEFNKMNK